MNKFYQNRTSHLWQRNYYEHIIRNEYDLYFTREYILNNPKNWDKDSNNPLKSP